MSAAVSPPTLSGAAYSAVVVGLGNIGSHTAELLLRLGVIRRLRLLDRDIYEPRNLAGQGITASDVGRPKALAQARRLRRIDPLAAIEARVDDLENVPLGWLHADIVLGCLDSRRARQVLAAACWNLGVVYVDAGVRNDGWLARVNVYRPDDEAACLECAYDGDADYARLEQTHPCLEGDATAPTDAPAGLGALAAALQVLEAAKQLRREPGGTLAGRQLVVDAAWHNHLISSFERNPGCRFDHQIWPIQPLVLDPRRAGLGQLLGRLRQDAPVALRVAGQFFARHFVCDCGRERDALRLSRRPRRHPRCRGCGAAMIATGVGSEHWPAAFSRREQDLTLDRIGIQTGDVISVRGSDGLRHYQIVAEG